MVRRWVVNSSPLIVLGKTSLLHLLVELCSEIAIPEGVAQEINRGPRDDPTRTWLREKGDSLIVPPGPVSPTVEAWDLGLGETQVVSFALSNPGYQAIIDDRAARRCASSFGIPVRGTLSVVLLGKRAGLFPSVELVLNQMLQNGFRIRPELVRAMLRLAGE